MLTTATPGAHAFNIASSAANPPNDAPYPTDVGSATTGDEMRPATTLGEGAVHAGRNDHHAGSPEQIEVPQDPVQPGDPDVNDQ